ncbi:uncharacterized protein LOC120350892 [Nilaparvata lugens]|uniref:uncharacterized protein LOC120350892 n=1 Tax=Nilaparvata lugens TaxID=108931 RepID=UPI00193E7E2F|nr:uncharacterized protein LOC120350892 [Nilaparvata lugens]
MYRDRSYLWDSSDVDYKNRNKRHDGLVEIAVSFGIEKVEVEKKIRNLQSQFAREKKKESKSRKTGTGADDAYTSKWFAYKALMFLADKNKPRNTQDTEGSQEPEFKEQQRENDNEESVEQSQTSNSKDNNGSASTPPPEDAFTSPKTPIKKRKVRSTSAGSAPIMNEAVNLLRSIQS